MIEITKKQAEILSVLIKNKKRTLGKYIGISANGLEDYGINRGTFRKNKDFLLSNYLVNLILKETHGDQIWEFFDATVLGFLILYQNMLEKTVLWQRISYSSFERFFPIIYRNWNELKEIYKKDREGYRPIDFLELAIQQLSIQYEDNIWTSPFPKIGRNKPLLVKVNLDFGYFDIAIKSSFHFQKRMFKFPRKFPIKQVFDDLDLFMKNLSEKITFLFFFNMFQREASYSYGEGVVSLPLFSEFMQKTDGGKKLKQNYAAQINKIISLIKNDKELNQLFVNLLKFTFKNIKQDTLTLFLSKIFEGKPHFVLWKE